MDFLGKLAGRNLLTISCRNSPTMSTQASIKDSFHIYDTLYALLNKQYQATDFLKIIHALQQTAFWVHFPRWIFFHQRTCSPTLAVVCLRVLLPEQC